MLAKTQELWVIQEKKKSLLPTAIAVAGMLFYSGCLRPNPTGWCKKG